MGWTCQHDFQGYCKLLKKVCVPGMKGCIIKKADNVTFSGREDLHDYSDEQKEEPIDFAALAKSH